MLELKNKNVLFLIKELADIDEKELEVLSIIVKEELQRRIFYKEAEKYRKENGII